MISHKIEDNRLIITAFMQYIIRQATINDLKDIQSLNLLLFKKEQKEYDITLNTERTYSEK
jgi:hypothetical protein